LPALAVTAVLTVLSHTQLVFRWSAGAAASVASLLYPPAAPALLLVMQFAPSLVLMGASTVPTSEFLFAGLMLLNLFVRDAIRDRKNGRTELYVSYSTRVTCLLFILLVATSKAWEGSDWPLTVQEFAAYCMALLTAYQLKRRSDQTVLLWAFIVVAAALSVWAIMREAAPALRAIERGPGFVDPNYYAYYVGTGLVAALSLFVEGTLTERLWLKVGFALLIVLTGVGVLDTASRGIAAAVALSACVMLAMRYRKPAQLALVAVLLACVAPFVYRLPAFDALRSRFSDSSLQSLSGRTDIWQNAITALQKSSIGDLLLGHGNGGSLMVLGGTVSHNLVFELILQYGLVGLGLAALVAARALRRAVKTKGYWGYTQTALWVYVLSVGMSIVNTQNYFTWVLVGMMLPQARRREAIAAPAVGRALASPRLEKGTS
jgi:O-antigen ligase